jgi:hypothetical protein
VSSRGFLYLPVWKKPGVNHIPFTLLKKWILFFPGFRSFLRLLDQLDQGKHLGLDRLLKGFAPFLIGEFLPEIFLNPENEMPAGYYPDTGKAEILPATIGKGDLMSQFGTADLQRIIGWS